MLSDTEFQTLAQRTLTQLRDRYELAFENAEIEELELEPGILTIVTATGKTFIVSAHSASKQVWLASPISGGLHFHWEECAQHWALKTGELLDVVLRQELEREGVLVL